MPSVTGLFRRGGSYCLKVVLPPAHPSRARYRSGRVVVSLGPVSHRDALLAATIRRVEILTAIPAGVMLKIVSPAPTLPSLREVHRRWSKSKATRTADAIAACSRALTLFEGFAGDIKLDEITRELGDGFRAWLQEAARRTTSKTARDRLTWVKTLLKYAHRDLGLLLSSPWAGLDIEARTTTKRRPWTAMELSLLFAQPLHTDYELPSAWNAGGAAAYWLPLLGLYTGARLSELAQLSPADVQEVDGIRFLDLNDEQPGKRIKTDAGRRCIPIHSELVRLGFLRYQASQQGPSLWPDLRQRDAKPGGYFSVWFAKYRRAIGLGTRPDFHCLRHTVRNAMASDGVRDDTIDALLGHEPGGSTGVRVYTHRTLQVLRHAIESLSASSTAHLQPVL